MSRCVVVRPWLGAARIGRVCIEKESGASVDRKWWSGNVVIVGLEPGNLVVTTKQVPIGTLRSVTSYFLQDEGYRVYLKPVVIRFDVKRDVAKTSSTVSGWEVMYRDTNN